MSSEKPQERETSPKESYYSMYSYNMTTQNRNGDFFQEEKYNIDENGQKDSYHRKTTKSKDTEPIIEENGNPELLNILNQNWNRSFFQNNFLLR